MNTLEVMCIEFTRHSPSRIPLSLSAACTCGVMFMKAMRALMCSGSSFLKLCIRRPSGACGSRQRCPTKAALKSTAVQSERIFPFTRGRRCAKEAFKQEGEAHDQDGGALGADGCAR